MGDFKAENNHLTLQRLGFHFKIITSEMKLEFEYYNNKVLSYLKTIYC